MTFDEVELRTSHSQNPREQLLSTGSAWRVHARAHREKKKKKGKELSLQSEAKKASQLNRQSLPPGISECSVALAKFNRVAFETFQSLYPFYLGGRL